ncbi:FxLYD domain-containing protein [Virgibacillus byunsanensis]|uniref:FxLYD domain-containing protein n=1 Tax=Virgibacillus byunsanensis TaxID=570945 RepID=A0ABW3LI85_9BACI
MFCQQCGKQINEASIYCMNCGSKVDPVTVPQEENEIEDLDINDNVELTEEDSTNELDSATNEIDDVKPSKTDNSQEDRQKRSKRKSSSTFTSILPFLIPIISILLAGGGLGAYYYYEQDINNKVLALQKSAEDAALEGEYEDAKGLLTQAKSMRPNYDVLEADLQIIMQVNEVLTNLDDIDEKIKNQKYGEAEEQLSALKVTINADSSPLYGSFDEMIASKEVTITVGKIKNQLDDLTTVEALADKLSVMETLSTDSGEKVRHQILNKIVQITTDQATVELDDKQFSNALVTVNKGLEYKTENEQLISLKEEIEQAKSAFENAEQERIEQAMEAAAKEDLKNRTEAVELTSFEVEMDEFGDLYIYGDVRNVATKAIDTVKIHYTIYDVDGNYYDDGYTNVYPYYLNPGEAGSFEDVFYYVNEEVTVEIDNITWYLE